MDFWIGLRLPRQDGSRSEFARENRPLKAVALVAMLAVTGCHEPIEAPVVLIDTQRDISHQHKHQHGGQLKHDHDHDDQYEGTHTHPHAHGHRHPRAPHGGRVAEIGPTADDAGLVHLEVMPVSESTVSLYLLSESADGEFRTIAPIGTPVVAEVVDLDGVARSIEFSRFDLGGDDTGLSAVLPADLQSQDRISIHLPRLTVDGETFTDVILDVDVTGSADTR